MKFGNKIKFALSFIKHNILQVIISFILLFAGLTMYGISDAYYSFDLSGQVTQRIEDCSDNYISISTFDFKDIKYRKKILRRVQVLSYMRGTIVLSISKIVSRDLS